MKVHVQRKNNEFYVEFDYFQKRFGLMQCDRRILIVGQIKEQYIQLQLNVQNVHEESDKNSYELEQIHYDDNISLRQFIPPSALQFKITKKLIRKQKEKVKYSENEIFVHWDFGKKQCSQKSSRYGIQAQIIQDYVWVEFYIREVYKEAFSYIQKGAKNTLRFKEIQDIFIQQKIESVIQLKLSKRICMKKKERVFQQKIQAQAFHANYEDSLEEMNIFEIGPGVSLLQMYKMIVQDIEEQQETFQEKKMLTTKVKPQANRDDSKAQEQKDERAIQKKLFK